jgi:lysophospholipase L1-like esterase
VNAAIEVAAQPYRAHVRVLDMEALFTPGGRYRAAMTVGGRPQIVREPDGIHLNERGAELAADAVVEAVEADFAKALP